MQARIEKRGFGVDVATANVVHRYWPARTLLATISLASIGLDLAPGAAGILTASGGTIRRINLADNSIAPAQITPAVGGTLNFFRWPPPPFAPQPVVVESGGQRYLGMQFQVTKWSPGQTRVQFSSDLFSWQDAVAYTPTGTGVTRSSPALTVQHQFVEQGDTVLITERDAEPAGSRQRRFYRVPSG